MTRAEVANCRYEQLSLSRRLHPDVRLCYPRRGSSPVVVKDFAGKPPLLRHFLRWWRVGREIKVLRRLEGTAGIPRLIACPEADLIVVEHIEGTIISQYPGTHDENRVVIKRLEQLVEDMLSRDVIVMDLKHRSNILVTKDRQPFIVDFCGAFLVPRMFGLSKIFVPLLRWCNHRAIRKWRCRLPGVGSGSGSKF